MHVPVRKRQDDLGLSFISGDLRDPPPASAYQPPTGQVISRDLSPRHNCHPSPALPHPPPLLSEDLSGDLPQTDLGVNLAAALKGSPGPIPDPDQGPPGVP